MEAKFAFLGLSLSTFLQGMVEVCPDPEPTVETEPTSVSEWATSKFNLTFGPKQTEVLDCTARFLMLCCNRQWGKTTTIALKALHRALTVPDQSIVIIS